MKVATLLFSLALFTATAFGQPISYVVNSLGETISTVELTTLTVSNNTISLGSDVGSAPNQILIWGECGYVVNSSTNELQVLDLLGDSTIGFIDFPPFSNPYWIDLANDSLAYVSLLVDNSIATVDLKKDSVVRTDSIGKSPQALAVWRDTVFVAMTGFDFSTFQYDPGEVAIYDRVTQSRIGAIPVGLNPQFMAWDSQGRLHVVCTGDFATVFGAVYVIDPAAGGVVDSVVLGGSPGQIVIDQDDIAYVAGGGFSGPGNVFVYNASDLTVIRDAASPLVLATSQIGVGLLDSPGALALSFADTGQIIDSTGASATFVLGDGPLQADLNWLAGDVNGDWSVDLADLSRLIDFLFVSFTPLPQPVWRANVAVDGNGDIGLPDLSRLIDHLFLTFQPLDISPRWVR